MPTLSRYSVRAELPALRPEVRRFSAVQESLGRGVEIRLLDEPVGGPDEAHLRFRKECEALLTLDHAAVIKVLDVGVTQGRLFYVTDLRDSSCLAELLEEAKGALPAYEAFRMASEVLDGLGHLHGCGLLMRRLDARSIFLNRSTGHYYLGDFSLLKKVGSGSLTEAGVKPFAGLPALPEGRALGDLDARSDLFLMGAMLYQAFTGHDIWPEVSAAIAQQVELRLDPLSSRQPDLPRALDELLERALSFDPARRPGDAREMAVALTRAKEALRVREASRAVAQPAARAPSEWAKPSRRVPVAGELPPEASVWPRVVVVAGVLLTGTLFLARPEEAPTVPSKASPRASAGAPVRPGELARLVAEIRRQPTGTGTFLRRWDVAHRYHSPLGGATPGRLVALKLDYFRNPAQACAALDRIFLATAAGGDP